MKAHRDKGKDELSLLFTATKQPGCILGCSVRLHQRLWTQHVDYRIRLRLDKSQIIFVTFSWLHLLHLHLSYERKLHCFIFAEARVQHQ